MTWITWLKSCHICPFHSSRLIYHHAICGILDVECKVKLSMILNGFELDMNSTAYLLIDLSKFSGIHFGWLIFGKSWRTLQESIKRPFAYISIGMCTNLHKFRKDLRNRLFIRFVCRNYFLILEWCFSKWRILLEFCSITLIEEMALLS